MTRPRRGGERGSAVVDFTLVSMLALTTALAVLQMAVFLYERNAVMGSIAEGARDAAVSGRDWQDGVQSATDLLDKSVAGRVTGPGGVTISGQEDGDLVVIRAQGQIPSLFPFVPDLPVNMTASMHDEEDL